MTPYPLQNGSLRGLFWPSGGSWPGLGADYAPRGGPGGLLGGSGGAPVPNKSSPRRPRTRKKVVQEGSDSLLADLMARFQPKWEDLAKSEFPRRLPGTLTNLQAPYEPTTSQAPP